MTKRKLERFAEMAGFKNVIQPVFEDIFKKEHPLKGKWNSDFFIKDQSIIAEFGCGKGEYTVGLAKKFSQKNFIGVDIKGARIWKGAKTAIEENIVNAAFLRTRIEFLRSFFNENEIDEIWLTFPDPQPKKARKRLSSEVYLNLYRNFLKPDGIVHLKTDNEDLYRYSLSLVRFNELPIISCCEDLYNSPVSGETFGIKTYYEQKFLAQGLPIFYLKFKLINKTIVELPENG